MRPSVAALNIEQAFNYFNETLGIYFTHGVAMNCECRGVRYCPLGRKLRDQVNQAHRETWPLLRNGYDPRSFNKIV